MKPKDLFDTNLENISRKKFLKLSAAAATAFALPNIGSSGCSTAQYKNVPSIKYDKDLVLINCNLIDVNTGKISKNASIRIRKGIIHTIGKEKPDPVKEIIHDVGGKYVIPGLIDAHCHSTVSPVFEMQLADLFMHINQQKRNYTASIESGVTTMRDVGAFPGSLHGFIKDIENGKLNGPRILFCNSMINVMGGHPDTNPTDINIFAKPASLFIGMIMTNFESNEELQEALIKHSKDASLVKLTMDNKSVFCRKGEIAVYSDEHLKIAHDFAQKKGLPVACHCQLEYGFKRAIKYPVHSVEHIVSDAFIPDKDIDTMVKKNIAIVPTITIGQSFSMEEAYDELPKKFQEDFIFNELKIRREYLSNTPASHCDPRIHRLNLNMLKFYKQLGWDNLWDSKKFLTNPDMFFGMLKYGPKNLIKMRDAGVLIGTGIDAGMPLTYFGGIYRELEFFSRAGFTNLEVLRCGTINSAKILKAEDRIGSIEQGKYADMVILSKNPLKDITAYRNPDIVIKDGKLVHSKNKLKVDTAAAAS